ncbi:metal-dependent transcriptional regulator [Halarchaeum sp. CBA1220]|uniref:metal-dependent transcriptional regulator n=1 Tax=Halarchaeum sp. CBA1220 TaxID=1853682 RepID=UPI000F3A94CC|nr:metal-dependent transcriptional regulator [Halarchaeum sp. CBA1220]QLC34111.1 metal-dependent transcriptional regulator [Halarchaeum sp. CBA1220]
MLSDVMEDYLKAIYVLEREDGAPVRTSALAEYLGVTPPTVTSMIEKLEERGLLDREKYKGVELTEEGETVALEVLRHHRLIESYLAEHLDYEWSEVHEEADALEHHISEEFERRVAAALGDPRVDPHGDPIPTEDLSPLADDDTVALASVSEGDTVVVARVSDRDDDHLDYLAARGVEPGARLDVVDIAPIDLITVRVDDRDVHLPTSIASAIRVRAPDDAEADEVPA